MKTNILKYLIVLVAIFTSSVLNAMTFKDETLNYRVLYKWGLVNKQAGRATLSIRNHGTQYRTTLTACSEQWADKFFKVRDTLSGIIEKENFRPTIYTKISHEGSEHKHDVVRYKYQGARIIGNCTRKKWDDDGNLTLSDERTLDAYGTTVDMLSSFYYMRTLPFEKWKVGHVITLNIYSGKRKELLTIKYLGTEKIKCDKIEYNCYKILFSFTTDGKTKSSDDLFAWISTGEDRIPIKMEGKLKVGAIHCYYTGSK